MALKTRMVRIPKKTLDDVCLDCCDNLKHKCVECEDCPVKRLKELLKNPRRRGLQPNVKAGR